MAIRPTQLCERTISGLLGPQTTATTGQNTTDTHTDSFPLWPVASLAILQVRQLESVREVVRSGRGNEGEGVQAMAAQVTAVQAKIS